MLFQNLSLIDPILKAVQEEGYTEPTPIQEVAIPIVLNGTDLLGCAQTGTGKRPPLPFPFCSFSMPKPSAETPEGTSNL